MLQFVTSPDPRGPQGDVNIQNIKALGYPVSVKKNYEVFVLCFYVQFVTLQGRASFDPRAFYEKTW